MKVRISYFEYIRKHDMPRLRLKISEGSSMNYIKYIFFFTSIIFLAGACNTETPLLYIHRENDFVIEAKQSLIETRFVVIRLENTIVKELEANGISKDQIKSIHAGKGLFTPVFDDFDYGYLSKLSIWLVSAENPSIRKEIYYRDEIPLSKKNELKLLSGLADLKDFIYSEEKYNLEIQLNFRNFVPANIDNRFTYSFAIFTN